MPYDSSLPAGTEYARRYEHLIRIWDENATPEPAFIYVRRADQIVYTPTPIRDNAQTNDDLGSPNEDVSGWGWTLAFRVIPARITATRELVDEYKILNAAVGDAIGSAAVIKAQWFDAPAEGAVGDPDSAWEGDATVAIAPVDDGSTERWAVTLTGKGPAVRLAANPFDGRA